MLKIALKMLFGDATKCVGLIFAIAFSSLLIMQQASIFVSLLARTSSVILDAEEANLWVMDASVQYIEAGRPMKGTELARVRGVPGVAWAVPLFKSTAGVRSEAGELESAQILGVDEATYIGASRRVVLGSLTALREPDAVMVDADGYALLFPGQPLALGRSFEINDHRAVVVAIVRSSANFTANLTIFTTYARALGYSNTGRNQLSFVLARAAPGHSAEAVAREVSLRTGLRARTSDEFRGDTIDYILANTGIPIAFGATIGLGVIVGIAVAGLTFNMFVVENIRQFAALKAIGIDNRTIFAMVLCQAAAVGTIGFGLGLGAVATFFDRVPKIAVGLRGMYLPWQIAAGTAALTVVIMLLASVVSLRRVLTVDPAIVFRGG